LLSERRTFFSLSVAIRSDSEYREYRESGELTT